MFTGSLTRQQVRVTTLSSLHDRSIEVKQLLVQFSVEVLVICFRCISDSMQVLGEGTDFSSEASFALSTLK